MTTKANSRRTSRTRRLRLVVVIGLVFVLLAVVLPRAVSLVASLVITPVVMTEDWLLHSRDTVPMYLRDRNELIAAQRELERELAARDGSEYAINQLLVENEELRALLGTASTSRIGAGVIGRPTELPYDTILIDRGSRDGVIENAPVFAGAEQAIGFIGGVYPHTAVVVLATTPGISSTVYIYGPNIYTVAEGMGGGIIRVHVPQGIALEPGNLVVMPTFVSGVYGEIVSVESVPTRPEQYGYAALSTPVAHLRFVSVGTEALEPLDFASAREVVEAVREDMLSVPVPAGVLIDSTGTSTATTTASSTENI